MEAILFVIGGIYLTLVGVRNNAEPLFSQITQESQFLYWVIVILVITALWETQDGAMIAKPAAVLIVLGFLLRSNGGTPNYQLVMTGLQGALKAPTATP
jgi:hypothetical membrane protein